LSRTTTLSRTLPGLLADIGLALRYGPVYDIDVVLCW
jgi:hypothetical protein